MEAKIGLPQAGQQKMNRGDADAQRTLAKELNIGFHRQFIGGYSPREVDQVIDRLLAKIKELSHTNSSQNADHNSGNLMRELDELMRELDF